MSSSSAISPTSRPPPRSWRSPWHPASWCCGPAVTARSPSGWPTGPRPGCAARRSWSPPFGSWARDAAVDPRFRRRPGRGRHAALSVTAAASARPGEAWWVLIKVMYFGRTRYTEAIACSIADRSPGETLEVAGINLRKTMTTDIGDPHRQSPRGAEQLRRPRAGSGGACPAARRGPRADPVRAGRHRQDPAGAPAGRRARAGLPGRGVAGGARRHRRTRPWSRCGSPPCWGSGRSPAGR